MKHMWLSSKRMTVLADVQDGLVVKAAPVVRKFIGQPLVNLVRWMKRQGGFQMVEIGAKEN